SSARKQVEDALGDQGLVAVVNNAGIGGGGPIEFMDLDEIRNVIEVNLVGQIAVTQAFLGLLRRATGTVVFLASLGGGPASPSLSPYHMSKFAVEALGESLRHELAPWDIDVAVVEPGSVDTAIWTRAAERVDERIEELPEDARRLYGPQLQRFGEVLTETASRGIPPDRVAEATPPATRPETPKPRSRAGTEARVAAGLKATPPDRVFSKAIARQLKMPTAVPAE